MKKITAIVLALCLAAALLTGCGSSSYKAESVYESPAYANSAVAAAGDYGAEYAYEEEYDSSYAMNEAASDSSSTTASLPTGRKFIITSNVSAETEDLDPILTWLNEKLTAVNGYLESQSINNSSYYNGKRSRSADMTLRIPTAKLDEFLNGLSAVSNVTSSSRSTEDVTLQYVDTEGRIAAYETEQTRLLELMAQADNMADLLEIESRLTEVRYQLDMYQTRLRNLDNKIDYSTVYLYVREVVKYTPVAEKTFLEKVKEGFADSLETLGEELIDFCAWFIINLPYLIFYGILLWIFIALLRRRRKKKAANAAAAPKEKKPRWSFRKKGKEDTAEPAEPRE